MVIGVGLADAVGTGPIAKKAIVHRAIATEKYLLCRIISILFYGELFFVFAVMEVLPKTAAEVTRKTAGPT